MDDLPKNRMPPPPLEAHDCATLINVARDSIDCGLRTGEPLPVDLCACAPPLAALGATFVTLRIKGLLRGCVGSLEAVRPLAADVAHHACKAAFCDPRFPPLTPVERDGLEIHVSVLSLPQAVSCADEQDLIAQLQPGIDGLVLEHGPNRATFLPSVWKQFPEANRFLDRLKIKAGIADWPRDIKVSRYTVQEIMEEGSER